MITALLSQKGGSGKTSLAMNLAAALVRRGRLAVVVDLDPQGSAAMWAEQGELPFRVVSSCLDYRRFLDLMEQQRGDVLLDCPPGLADPALMAAVWADLVLIPSGASPLDLWGVRAALATIAEARAVRSGAGPAVALVPYRVQPRTLVGRALPDLLRGMGEAVAPGIRQRVAVATSAALGQTAPPPAAAEFDAVAKFVLSRLRKLEKAKSP